MSRGEVAHVGTTPKRSPIRVCRLLFGVTRKVLRIAVVAVPHLVADDIDEATSEVLLSCSFLI